MKPSYVVAGVILIASLVFTLFAFSSGIAPYVTVAEAMARPGESLQVKGKILKETVAYDAHKGSLVFDIVDPKNQKMTVVYAQPKPENFDTATSVDAIGSYHNGAFRAHTLLVKCPSKYSDEKSAKTAGM